MVQAWLLSDSQLIEYVERIGKRVIQTGETPFRWLRYRNELEKRGYTFSFATGKIIRLGLTIDKKPIRDIKYSERKYISDTKIRW